jgi:Na+-translocating ferredoxin:NAD+ oxidoreductase subunit C
VGLGGAAFPTHVKLKIPEGKTCEYLIINGIECEPYLTTDHRVMLEQADDIFMGIRYVLKVTGAKEVIIGIEANKQDAADHLSGKIPSGFTRKGTGGSCKISTGSRENADYFPYRQRSSFRRIAH